MCGSRFRTSRPKVEKRGSGLAFAVYRYGLTLIKTDQEIRIYELRGWREKSRSEFAVDGLQLGPRFMDWAFQQPQLQISKLGRPPSTPFQQLAPLPYSYLVLGVNVRLFCHTRLDRRPLREASISRRLQPTPTLRACYLVLLWYKPECAESLYQVWERFAHWLQGPTDHGVVTT